MHSIVFLRHCNLPSLGRPSEDLESNFGSCNHEIKTLLARVYKTLLARVYKTLLARVNKSLGSECEHHNYLMSHKIDAFR